MERVTNANDLTPVEQRAGMWFKRDDLYQPFGEGEVNGGKLRQCVMLLSNALEKRNYRGVVTYCSIHSPQGPITAAVANDNGLPCVICYGGVSDRTLSRYAMPNLCRKYGARIDSEARSGRHNVLKARAEEIAKAKGYFVVEYGINLDKYRETLIQAVARQVENLPDGIDNLYITCGSGITASGVMAGINQYGKNVKKVHLIATGFDRRKRINETLNLFGVRMNYEYHDLFHQRGFAYDKREEMRIDGLKLHPQYEAKVMRYIIDNALPTANGLLWVVGAEPRNP